jgi:hypothetical protein
VDLETNWIDVWLGMDQASCCGVNLVFDGFRGVWFFGDGEALRRRAAPIQEIDICMYLVEVAMTSQTAVVCG